MQTIEKALHQPMPFTTGGQTISDRLTAAKHSLAGSQLGKTICKATTEELMAPKKKHLDYLLHCTNEPNVSIPSMANLLIERTQHPSWTVVYKALITIHNIMCYGNERFSQYLASCNTTFNLGNFLDKNSTSGFRRDASSQSPYSYQLDQHSGEWYPGYDMSQHVRKYGKYIGEKIATYRVCAFDFCKVKRGREDGLLRTMHTDKLLKTLPILQNQIDALLEFSVSPSELNNGVINCSFILLFRDLIRLFACYNDGIINLLEKYFDMNKKQCREALDTYKGFLTRLDKVSDFLRVAETVGIDKGEIPDLTRAPASLLEALESHLIHLEGGRPPPPQMSAVQSQVTNFSIHGGFQQPASVGDADRQRYIDLENQRLRQFEEQKKDLAASSHNPFAADVGAPTTSTAPSGKKNDDLLDLFNSPAVTAAPVDHTNPFAQFAGPPVTQHPASHMYPMGVPPASTATMKPSSLLNGSSNGTTGFNNGLHSLNGLGAAKPQTSIYSNGTSANGIGTSSSLSSLEGQGGDFNPFLTGAGSQRPSVDPSQWQPDFTQNQSGINPFMQAPAGAYPTEASTVAPAGTHAHATTDAVVSQPIPAPTPVASSTAPMPIAEQQRLGIYEQTPFSQHDGSYTAAPSFPPHMLQMHSNSSAEQSPAHHDYANTQQIQQQGFDPFNTSQADSTMGAFNAMSLNDAKSSQSGAPPSRPPAPTAVSSATTTAPASMVSGPQQIMAAYGQPQMMYGQPYGQPYPYQQQMQWGMQQQPGMYQMQQPGYGMYAGQAPMGFPQVSQQQQVPSHMQQQQQPKDPFSGF